MRSQGKITHWNTEKGYGFITPSAGAKQVFVHISSFASRTPPPRVDQLVTFTLSSDKAGRPCAVDVTRAGEPPPKKARPSRRSGLNWKAAVPFVIVLLAAAVGYSKYQKSQTGFYLPVTAPVPASSRPQPSPQYRCDGRQYCGQMNSCAEAEFFLENCPNNKMDGDDDGVPCEWEWCG